MLEILVVVIAMLVMARTPKRRRRMGRYIRGNVDENLDLGTLASLTLVAVPFDETVSERTFVSSLVAIWSLSDFTEIAEAGPIMVGVAHSDYSAAEIEEWIETTGSWAEADTVQSREVGRRMCRTIGIFRGTASGVGAADVLNDGKAIKTKLGWILNAGQTLDLWAYNLGTAAVGTTDPNVRAEGHVNLFPR